MPKSRIKYLSGLLLLIVKLALFTGDGTDAGHVPAEFGIWPTDPAACVIYASGEADHCHPAELNDEGCSTRPIHSRPRSSTDGYLKALSPAFASGSTISDRQPLPGRVCCRALRCRATCDFLCTYRC